jgi:hypothetical protein
MANDAYVQVAADGAGKRIDNATLKLPIGTVVLNADGTETTLAAETVVYRQRVVIGDSALLGEAGVAAVRDGKLQVEDRTLQVLEEMAVSLDEINEKLSLMFTH